MDIFICILDIVSSTKKKKHPTTITSYNPPYFLSPKLKNQNWKKKQKVNIRLWIRSRARRLYPRSRVTCRRRRIIISWIPHRYKDNWLSTTTNTRQMLSPFFLLRLLLLLLPPLLLLPIFLIPQQPTTPPPPQQPPQPTTVLQIKILIMLYMMKCVNHLLLRVRSLF